MELRPPAAFPVAFLPPCTADLDSTERGSSNAHHLGRPDSPEPSSRRCSAFSRLFTAIDHVGVAVSDLDDAIRLLPRRPRHAAGARGVQRRPGRPRSHDGASATPSQLRAAAGPAVGRLAHRQVPRDAADPACSKWPIASTTSTRSLRRHSATAASACSYDEPKPRNRWRPHQLHPPQGRRRGTRRDRRASPVQGLANARSPSSDHRLGGRRATHPADRGRHHCPATPRRDDFANLEIPDHYTAALLRKEDEAMFEGITDARPRPAQVAAHRGRSRFQSWDPARRSSRSWRPSINYNTVWSSIFEPVSTFASSAATARRLPSPSATTFRTTSLALTSPASCCAPDLGVHAWKPGDRSRRALCVGRAREPARPQRHDARSRAAHLGFRDQLRWARADRAGEGQPAARQAQRTSRGKKPRRPAW